MKILFITLSNIGDCILTLPVLDFLIERYESPDISVLVGPRAKEIFFKNSFVKEVIIYNKRTSLKDKLDIVKQLSSKGFDLIIDLRHTLFPFFIKAKLGTHLFVLFNKNALHMKDKHRDRLKKSHFSNAGQGKDAVKHFFQINTNDLSKKYKDYIIVAPGTRSLIKRWTANGFVGLCNKIIYRLGLDVILVGDNYDMLITDEIYSKIKDKKKVINLGGRTGLSELADLMKTAKAVVSCDSASLHLASYLNKPIVAIFGPTDPRYYGPWSDKSAVVREELECIPCEQSNCRMNNLECMNLIDVDSVFLPLERICQ